MLSHFLGPIQQNSKKPHRIYLHYRMSNFCTKWLWAMNFNYFTGFYFSMTLCVVTQTTQGVLQNLPPFSFNSNTSEKLSEL